MNVCLRLTLLLIISLQFACREKKSDLKVEGAILEVTDSVGTDWISLFNGVDLDGWTMKINGYPLGENFGNTFRVEDSLLHIRYDAYGPEFNDRFGALFFDREFSDFRLKVEYRFVGETAPGAPDWGYRDSGIQFYTQAPETVALDQRFPICLEYNLHGGNGTDERPLGAICGIGMFVEINGAKNSSFCTPAVLSKTFHGDQWVLAEIEVKDNKMTHFVNGIEILSYANASLDPENEDAKGLIKNDDLMVNSGYISLQSNSHPIDFRKIELKVY